MTRTAVLVSVAIHLVVLGGLWVAGPSQPIARPAVEREVVESARMQIRWVPRSTLPEVAPDPVPVAERLVAAAPRGDTPSATTFQPSSRGPGASTAHPSGVPSAEPSTVETSSAPKPSERASTPRVLLPPQPPTPTANPTSSPTLVSQVVVEYPELCRRLGHEGVVKLSLDVAPSGRVVSATVTRSSRCPRLDQAARTAALRLDYLPAHVDGAPRAGKADLEIRFSLDDNGS